jgi:hypothetical protein
MRSGIKTFLFFVGLATAVSPAPLFRVTKASGLILRFRNSGYKYLWDYTKDD